MCLLYDECFFAKQSFLNIDRLEMHQSEMNFENYGFDERLIFETIDFEKYFAL